MPTALVGVIPVLLCVSNTMSVRCAFDIIMKFVLLVQIFMPILTMSFIGAVMSGLVSQFSEYPALPMAFTSRSLLLHDTDLPVYSDGYVTTPVSA